MEVLNVALLKLLLKVNVGIFKIVGVQEEETETGSWVCSRKMGLGGVLGSSCTLGFGAPLGFDAPLVVVVLFLSFFFCEKQTMFGILMDTTEEGVGGDIERWDWGAGS